MEGEDKDKTPSPEEAEEKKKKRKRRGAAALAVRRFRLEEAERAALHPELVAWRSAFLVTYGDPSRWGQVVAVMDRASAMGLNKWRVALMYMTQNMATMERMIRLFPTRLVKGRNWFRLSFRSRVSDTGDLRVAPMRLFDSTHWQGPKGNFFPVYLHVPGVAEARRLAIIRVEHNQPHVDGTHMVVAGSWLTNSINSAHNAHVVVHMLPGEIMILQPGVVISHSMIISHARMDPETGRWGTLTTNSLVHMMLADMAMMPMVPHDVVPMVQTRCMAFSSAMTLTENRYFVGTTRNMAYRLDFTETGVMRQTLVILMRDARLPACQGIWTLKTWVFYILDVADNPLHQILVGIDQDSDRVSEALLRHRRSGDRITLVGTPITTCPTIDGGCIVWFMSRGPDGVSHIISLSPLDETGDIRRQMRLRLLWLRVAPSHHAQGRDEASFTTTHCTVVQRARLVKKGDVLGVFQMRVTMVSLESMMVVSQTGWINPSVWAHPWFNKHEDKFMEQAIVNVNRDIQITHVLPISLHNSIVLSRGGLGFFYEFSAIAFSHPDLIPPAASKPPTPEAEPEERDPMEIDNMMTTLSMSMEPRPIRTSVPMMDTVRCAWCGQTNSLRVDPWTWRTFCGKQCQLNEYRIQDKYDDDLEESWVQVMISKKKVDV